jgi:hypothetical protein
VQRVAILHDVPFGHLLGERRELARRRGLTLGGGGGGSGAFVFAFVVLAFVGRLRLAVCAGGGRRRTLVSVGAVLLFVSFPQGCRYSRLSLDRLHGTWNIPAVIQLNVFWLQNIVVTKSEKCQPPYRRRPRRPSPPSSGILRTGPSRV